MAAKRTAEPKPTGRPSKFTEALADEICARLSQGKPLAVICRDDHMPHPSTVRDWQKANGDFSLAIAGAREDGFDQIAADALLIADAVEAGVETTTKGDGAIETREGDMLGHRKLRIETRLKLLAKWDPKRYGERQTLEHTDPAGNNPFAALMEAVGSNGRPRPQTGD